MPDGCSTRCDQGAEMKADVAGTVACASTAADPTGPTTTPPQATDAPPLRSEAQQQQQQQPHPLSAGTSDTTPSPNGNAAASLGVPQHPAGGGGNAPAPADPRMTPVGAPAAAAAADVPATQGHAAMPPPPPPAMLSPNGRGGTQAQWVGGPGVAAAAAAASPPSHQPQQQMGDGGIAAAAAAAAGGGHVGVDSGAPPAPPVAGDVAGGAADPADAGSAAQGYRHFSYFGVASGHTMREGYSNTTDVLEAERAAAARGVAQPKEDVASQRVPDDPVWLPNGVTGHVPSGKFMCVEFPGLVNSASKAVRMLGGKSWLRRVATGEVKTTRVVFRPDTISPHAAFGDTTQVCGALIKVRTKRRYQRDPVTQEKVPVCVKLETCTLGTVTKKVVFSGMCDYQFLPPKGLVGQSLNLESMMQFTRLMAPPDVPLFLAPRIFSRLDKPLEYNFRSNPYSRRCVMHLPDGTVEHSRVTSRSSSGTNLLRTITWIDVEIPSIPPEDSINFLRRNPTYHPLYRKMKDLFQKRPVWSRVALCLVLSPTQGDLAHLLKQLLPIVSYSFSTGPYRKLYVRLGYDVRKVPEEGEIHPVLYESFDVRVKSATLRKMSVTTGRSAEVVPEGPQRTVPIHGRSAWPDPEDPIYWERIPITWDQYFELMSKGETRSARHRRSFPVRMLWLQYIDLKDPALLAELQHNARPQLEAPNGDMYQSWLPAERIVELRAKFQVKFVNWWHARNPHDAGMPALGELVSQARGEEFNESDSEHPTDPSGDEHGEGPEAKRARTEQRWETRARHRRSAYLRTRRLAEREQDARETALDAEGDFADDIDDLPAPAALGAASSGGSGRGGDGGVSDGPGGGAAVLAPNAAQSALNGWPSEGGMHEEEDEDGGWA